VRWRDVRGICLSVVAMCTGVSFGEPFLSGHAPSLRSLVANEERIRPDHLAGISALRFPQCPKHCWLSDLKLNSIFGP